jgi:hypothetical protein
MLLLQNQLPLYTSFFRSSLGTVMHLTFWM